MERCFNAKTHFRTNLRLFGPLCPVLVVQKAPARKKSLCRQCWETFRPIDNIRLQSLMCLATSRNGFFLQRLYSHNSRVSRDHSKTASKKVFVCLLYLGFTPHSLRILIHFLATHIRGVQMKERSHQSNITILFLGSFNDFSKQYININALPFYDGHHQPRSPVAWSRSC